MLFSWMRVEAWRSFLDLTTTCVGILTELGFHIVAEETDPHPPVPSNQSRTHETPSNDSLHLYILPSPTSTVVSSKTLIFLNAGSWSGWIKINIMSVLGGNRFALHPGLEEFV